MQRFDIYCIVIAAFVFVAFISVVLMYSNLRKDYDYLSCRLFDMNTELIRRADNRQTTCLDGIIQINDSLVGLASERSGELTVDIDDEDNPELWNIKQQVD